MIQDEMKTLEDKTNLLLDDLVVGSSSKIFQPDENKDSCDGSFSPNVCKIDEKKSSTGEDIEDLNNVSKNLNRINQDTYLLDPEGNQLTPEERKVANHVYDILQWSCIDNHKSFNLTPKDTLDIELINPNIRDTLSSLGSIKCKDPEKVFKPPRSIIYQDKEYLFHKFSGKNFAFVKYKCVDYHRCRGSIKMSSIDPLKPVELIRPHVSDCRSDSFGWKSQESLPKYYEVQEKYNFIVDYEIAQAADTTEHPNSIIKRLELKAKDMAIEEGTYIFPPDRINFMKALKRERHKLLYHPNLCFTKNKEKFLRFTYSINDENEIMQQCILWISDSKLKLLNSFPQSFISLSYTKIPSSFQVLLTILTYCKTTHLFHPCAFSLLTTDSCPALYTHLFTYLSQSLSFPPSTLTLPLHSTLVPTLKPLFPSTLLIGCFHSLLHKLYTYTQISHYKTHPHLKSFFACVQKSHFRYSSLKKSLAFTKSSLENTGNSGVFSELFGEFRKIVGEFGEILDYSVVKRVSCEMGERVERTGGEIREFVKGIMDVEGVQEGEVGVKWEEWGKERMEVERRAKERADMVLLDSDVEIDPPLRHYHCRGRKPLMNLLVEKNVIGEFGRKRREDAGKARAMEKIEYENRYPVPVDGKLFLVHKVARKRILRQRVDNTPTIKDEPSI
ncbi:unnamed protein product [Moneuplotes crassus]|uniref:Uncharacterized protein n=1 Tax=Euplotes crassus TaxID=5936 RepID=A0AAD1TZ13_EUPCR|nr:unnamed protein product [Moneuplotes crassus]